MFRESQNIMNGSFFDRIGVADMEKIHSAVIGWIFSDDCKALTNQQKSELLCSLFHVNPSQTFNSFVVEVEHHDIDILITFLNKTFNESFQLLHPPCDCIVRLSIPCRFDGLSAYSPRTSDQCQSVNLSGECSFFHGCQSAFLQHFNVCHFSFPLPVFASRTGYTPHPPRRCISSPSARAYIPGTVFP